MKNIHILPTDKPSRLYEFGGTYSLQPKAQENFRSYHIYITNDEKIKKGNWCLNPKTNKVIKVGHHGHYGYSSEKIILTTDDQLIDDGVQAVTNAFVEWFVKNPSCKEVDISNIEVEDYVGFAGHTGYPAFHNEYQINISKEEPKQETLKEEFCHYSGLPSPLAYETDYTAKHIEYCHDIAMKSLLEEAKQETLEEAFEKYVNKYYSGEGYERDIEKAVKFGAKWQAEQILQFLYSEITERRPYSSSKMCEKVVEFIEQLNAKK
jgi:hypothetical protein